MDAEETAFVMFRSDSRALVLSVGDLVHAGRCEFAFLHQVDLEYGRAEPAGAKSLDSAWLKVLQRGRLHEKNVLAGYRQHFGANSVVEIARPGELTESALLAAARRTLEAMRNGARVVHQATIFDGRLLGYADFLVREADGGWRVEDAKLTSANAFEADLQVAAYSAVLGAADVRLAPSAAIRLGDGTERQVLLDDVVPAFTGIRARLELLADEHAQRTTPVAWGQAGVEACGTCATCRAAIEADRDLLLVDGVGAEEKAALRAAGIRTIDDLAASDQVAADLPRSTVTRLQRQAALQLQSGELPNMPAFEVLHGDLLGRLPHADPGDLFLSFAAQGRPDRADAEPDHFFTAVAVGGASQAYWGDDRAAEAAEFLRFLREVLDRRRSHPRMRIYHFSPVDRPHLIDLAERSGAGREQIELLEEQGVLVDLCTITTDALMVGTPDRSLREIGRLADPERAHLLVAGDIATDRAEVRRLLEQGDLDGAAALRSRLERENFERCLLTWRLRDRLLDLMETIGVEPGSVAPPRRSPRRRSVVVRSIEALAHQENDGMHAVAAAALGYHGLEASVFWRGHNRRLHRPTDQWSDRTRGAARIDLGRVEQDWTEGKRGGFTRLLRLRVTTASGTSLKANDRVFLVYDRTVFDDPRASAGARSATDCTVREVHGNELVVEERAPRTARPWIVLPSAVAPARPPATSAIERAVEGWAVTLLGEGEQRSAATDLVQRRAPRFTTGEVRRVLGLDGRLDARASLIESLGALDGSFLAVQGPPGSGKTTVGAQVIAELVTRGWRIGVVAQSHAVVEHFLDRVVEEGADAGRVGKNPKFAGSHRFTPIGKNTVRTFMREHADGFVVGGTAWDLTNPDRVPKDSLDLLVIDEAGQFGLVNAIAVAQVARNLLLLGDPQQLAQVSQAQHRAGADSSALGWLLDGAAVLPERFGYFLDRTWRMHPALTRAVSDLSYAGELTAHERTRRRDLAGVAPGLHLRPVRSMGRTDASQEEADETVRLIRTLLGKRWAAGAAPRALAQEDVIVVAPYNAQVERLRSTLRDAGLPDVEVGTVDRFQGREAAIAIYSTTVSNFALRPQAMDFVLGRNRLNVAISRAQWAAYVVHSPALTDFVPRNAADAAALSRFLRLAEFAVLDERRPRTRPDRPAA
jgi:uncharacterized protein